MVVVHAPEPGPRPGLLSTVYLARLVINTVTTHIIKDRVIVSSGGGCPGLNKKGAWLLPPAAALVAQDIAGIGERCSES